MRIYLMCGLAFAGKSTLASAIAARTGAAIVSLDAINERRGLSGGLGIPEPEWAESHGIALREAEAFVASGASVVVDDTNCYRFLRDDYRALADRFGAECVVVFVDAPVTLAVGRLRDNEARLTRHPVTRAILLDLAERFEAPGADEPHVRFAPGEDVSSWLDSHLEPDGSRHVG